MMFSWMLDDCLLYFPGIYWAAVRMCAKRWEDRYVFNLKEADGFVYRNYIQVLHLRSSLHSFHSEAQTVYMVRFPGVMLNPGKKDDFLQRSLLGKLPPNEWSVWRAGGNLKPETLGISVRSLAAVPKGGLLPLLQMPAYFLRWSRMWHAWAWDIPSPVTSCASSSNLFKQNLCEHLLLPTLTSQAGRPCQSFVWFPPSPSTPPLSHYMASKEKVSGLLAPSFKNFP